MKFSDSHTVDLNPLLDVYPTILRFPEASDKKNTSKKTEFRHQQIQFMAFCYEGVATGKDVVIEGPTGLGKTRALIASIMPFLLSRPDNRVIYATRTGAQAINIMQEIRSILVFDPQGKLASIDASLYIGAARVKTTVCDRFEETSRGEKQCTNCPIQSLKWIDFPRHTVQGYRTLDKKEMELLRQQQKCPVAYLRSKSKWARILVCTFNYLYDPLWVEENLINKESTVLIIDEAHNFLEDATSQPFVTLTLPVDGEQLKDQGGNDRIERSFSIQKLIASNYQPPLDGVLSSLRDQLLILEDSIREGIGTFFTEENLVQKGNPANKDILEVDTYVIAEQRLNQFIESVNQRLEAISPYTVDLPKLYKLVMDAVSLTKRNKLLDGMAHRLKGHVHALLQMLEALNDIASKPYDYVCVFDKSGKIEFYTLHPRNKVQRAVSGFHIKIFCSATLSPTKDVAYLLGLHNGLYGATNPVFKDEKYCTFFVTGVHSGLKEDGKSKITGREKQILITLFRHAFRAAKGKNIGVFCSGDEVVGIVHSYIQELKKELFELNIHVLTHVGEKKEKQKRVTTPIIDDYGTLCSLLDIPTLSAAPTAENKIELFKEIRSPNRRLGITAILLGAQGGTLSEGVDYVGQQMEMVIAIGLAYPGFPVERMIGDIRSHYFFFQRGRRELGVDMAYRQVAYRKLAQSLGRANRRESDRSVLICADERLLAIKNTGDEGSDSYEYLSVTNARKNLRILQHPLHKPNKNIVLFEERPAEADAVKAYQVDSGLAIHADFITFEKMEEEIKKFYREGDLQ